MAWIPAKFRSECPCAQRISISPTATSAPHGPCTHGRPPDDRLALRRGPHPAAVVGPRRAGPRRSRFLWCAAECCSLAWIDLRKRLRFAPLQSETGQRILKANGLPINHLSGIVFVEDGRLYINSSAVLRACGHLRFPWPAVKVFLLVPRPFRNLAYQWVARNRYRWFGKKDECPLPDTADADRFL